MAGRAQNGAARGYIRYPAIFGDRIVFTAEDDLWQVPAEGGRAERLTAGVAEATHAHFSPDGQLLAFTGRDEGPAEVYVMPSEGGPARRITFQGDTAAIAGWTRDGAGILYASSTGQARRGMNYLWTVSPAGGEPAQTSYGLANSIAFGPHGAVVLGRNTGEPARWKRYRGGTAGYFWVDAKGKGEYQRLLDLAANMSSPWPSWTKRPSRSTNSGERADGLDSPVAARGTLARMHASASARSSGNASAGVTSLGWTW